MEELGYGVPTRVTYENTYITDPEGYGPGTRFERHKVKEVLDEMLTTRLQNQQYDPVKSSQISKMLADDLRERVRRPCTRANLQPSGVPTLQCQARLSTFPHRSRAHASGRQTAARTLCHRHARALGAHAMSCQLGTDHPASLDPVHLVPSTSYAQRHACRATPHVAKA